MVDHKREDFKKINELIFELEKEYDEGSTIRQFLFHARYNIDQALNLRQQIIKGRERLNK